MPNDVGWDGLIGGGGSPTSTESSSGWNALIAPASPAGADQPVPPTPPVARPWTQDLQQKLDANKKYSGQDYARDVLSSKLPAEQPPVSTEERKSITADLLKQTAKNAPAVYKKVAQNIEEHPKETLANAADLALPFVKTAGRPLVATAQLGALGGGALGGGLGVALAGGGLKAVGQGVVQGFQDAASSFVTSPFSHTLDPMGQGVINGAIGDSLNWIANYHPENSSVTNPTAQQRLDELKRVGTMVLPVVLPAALMVGAHLAATVPVTPELLAHAERIKYRIDDSVSKGVATQEAADFAKKLIDKNPHVVKGLGVNAVPQEGVAGGAYDPVNQLVELYGLTGQSGRLGIVHEVLHHVERMLPPTAREGLLFAYDAGLRGLTPEQAQWVKDYRTLQQAGGKSFDEFTPDEKLAATRIRAAGEAGKDPRSFYKFTNPSEFWAESGSELLDKRWQGGWQSAARDFVSSLADSLKGESRAKVRTALKAMGKGDGTFQSNEMLHEQMENWGIGGKVFRSHAYNTMIGLEGLKNLMGQKSGEEMHDDLLGGLILGKDPLEVWREKLAWEGPDGMLHKAISDSGSYITKEGQTAIELAKAGKGDQEHILGAVFDHPMLYTAYPNLEFSDVQIGHGGGTYFLPPDGENQMFGRIRLDLTTEQTALDQRSVILHEIQHAIQDLEGWARGGTAEEFVKAGWTKKLAREAYLRLAGEVEARYTQAVRNVSGKRLRELYPAAVMEHGGYPVGKQIVLGPYDDPAGPEALGLAARSRALYTMHDDLNSQPLMTPLEEELMRASGASDEQIKAVKAGRSMESAPVQGKYRGYGHAGNILDILRQKEEAAAAEAKRPANPKPRYKVQVNPDGTSKFIPLEEKTGTDEGVPATWESLLPDASQVSQNGPDRVENPPEGGNIGKMGTGPKGPTFDSKQSSQISNAPASGSSRLEVPASVYKDIGDVLNKMQAAVRRVNNALHALKQTVPEAGVRESILRRWLGDKSKVDRRTLSVAYDLERAFDEIGQKAEAVDERAAVNENFLQRALDGGYGTIKPELRKEVKTAGIRKLMKIVADSNARFVNEDVGDAFKLYSEAYTKATLQKGLIEYLKHPELGLAWKVGKYGRAPTGWLPVPSVSWAGYLVHPDLVPALKFVFDQTEPGLILKGTYLVGQTAKRVGVVGSLFHAMSLFQSAWAGVGPVWAVKEVALGVMDRVLKTRMSAITQAIDLYKTGGLGDRIDTLIKAGVKFDMNEDATTGLLHTLGNALDGVLSRMTGKDVRATGKVTQAIEDRTLGFFDRFTWDFMHTGLKAGVSMKLLEDMLRKNPGMDEAQAAEHVAKFVNTAFGGLNWYQVATDTSNNTLRNLQLGLFNRSGRMVLQTLFFAPDWTISTWKNFTAAFKRQGSIQGLVNPLTHADFARRYQLRTIMTYLTLLNGINYAMSGHYIWQNKDPFRLEFRDGTTMAPMKHAAEPFEWLKDPLKVLTNKLGFIPKFVGKTLMGDYRVPASKRALRELRDLVPFQLESGLEAKQGDGLSHFLWGEIGLPVYGHPSTAANKFSTP